MYELITCLHNVDKMFLDYNEEMKKAILEDIKRFVPHLSPMRKSKQVFFCDVPKTLLFYYNKQNFMYLILFNHIIFRIKFNFSYF